MVPNAAAAAASQQQYLASLGINCDSNVSLERQSLQQLCIWYAAVAAVNSR
jgi:hypothetical protein